MTWNVILEIVCVVACVLHAILGVIRGHRTDKKINALCLKCGASFDASVKHACELDDSQSDALLAFVKSMKEGKR